MKVILQQDVKGHGKKGQMVDAADGYARNYLLPKKLAVEATAANVNAMKLHDAAQMHRAAEEKAAAEASAARLRDKTVRIGIKAGAGGKLFGAVTAKEVAELIRVQCGLDVPKNKLTLSDTVKALGTYDVKVRLHPEVQVTLHLVVEAQEV